MLLLLGCTLAAAAVLDDALVGGIVAMDDTLDVGGGAMLSDGAGELLLDIVGGPADRRFTGVRQWNVGYSGVQLMLGKERKAHLAAVAAAPRGTRPPAPPKGKLVLGDMTFRIGGRSWAGEGFGVDFGGAGIVNLLQPAGLAPWEAWLGPSVGALSRVRYDLDGGPGRGQVLVTGGLGGSGDIAQRWFVRADARALWEPATAELHLRGDLVTTVSFTEDDLPLAFQVRGHGEWDTAGFGLTDAGVSLAVTFAASTVAKEKPPGVPPERLPPTPGARPEPPPEPPPLGAPPAPPPDAPAPG